MLFLSELLSSTVLASWAIFPELEQPLLDVSLVVIFLCWSCQPKFRLGALQLIPGPACSLCSCCIFWKAMPCVKSVSSGGQMQHGEAHGGLMWHSSCQHRLKCQNYCGVTVSPSAAHAIISGGEIAACLIAAFLSPCLSPWPKFMCICYPAGES